MATPNGDFNEIRAILKEVAIRVDQHDKILLRHSEILAEHDERMERVGRHLEVLANVVRRPDPQQGRPKNATVALPADSRYTSKEETPRSRRIQ